MSVVITLPDAALHILGRADVRADALALDWTNSGVFFRFCGKTLSFQFDAPALNQPLYVQIRLDGRWTRVGVSPDSTTVCIDAPEDGEHRVSLVRINEILDAAPLVLRTITIDGNAPSLLPKPVMPDRRMLFIGDSITCGYGLLTRGLGNGFKTVEQDGAHTFAALTADHFGAEAQFICISGRGIVRNCDNEPAPLIPQFFEQTCVSNPTPWDHSAYIPDIIVVNAGTNDTAGEIDPIDPAVFAKGATAFVRRLRELYPQAKVLWVYGMMDESLHEPLSESLSAMQDDHVQYLKLQSVWGFENERGASNHPNQRAHRRCAGVVIDKVSELTGWDY